MSKTTAILLNLFSSVCFAFSTVFAKYAHNASAELYSFQVSFARFFLGAICMLIFTKVFHKPLKPNRLSYVVARGILNTAAVIALYYALQHTTITKANMLNWTFPVFVFIFSPFINRERPGLKLYFFLLLTMVGMGLVISPDFSAINLGDVAAFASGILGGAAVSVLRESRKYDETFMVLFYLMMIGSLLNGLIAAPFLISPPLPVWGLIIASALCGFLAQILITTSSRHLEAPLASVLLSSGILFAGAMGMVFFGERLSGKILLGGACILVSIVGVSGIVTTNKNRLTN